MKMRFGLAVILIISSLFMSNVCWAGVGEKSRLLSGIEFFTGYRGGKLDEQGNFQSIPFLVDFDFDIKELAKKIGFKAPGLLQFQIEPAVYAILEPVSNFEIENSFLFKIGFVPETSKLVPYLQAGVGLDYMTLHTRMEGTQFNFTESAGLGMHYFIDKNTAITLEGRFRHLSNADTKAPNRGFNTYFGLIGISYLF